MQNSVGKLRLRSFKKVTRALIIKKLRKDGGQASASSEKRSGTHPWIKINSVIEHSLVTQLCRWVTICRSRTRDLHHWERKACLSCLLQSLRRLERSNNPRVKSLLMFQRWRMMTRVKAVLVVLMTLLLKMAISKSELKNRAIIAISQSLMKQSSRKSLSTSFWQWGNQRTISRSAYPLCRPLKRLNSVKLLKRSIA